MRWIPAHPGIEMFGRGGVLPGMEWCPGVARRGVFFFCA